ncbi:PREDICTED: uncharacterized protein LOC100635560 [Amphimedon queenslandica]|uniref:Roadblock/LAMTOR2 domain-containing protein n=1 Tax=Amphimedon queenslandica TaxID=400682 RepID=A0A1X7V4Z0_AMPQE|nr:PREDICTED: uncharacterized protein LOC100635560 [Amphimedon queenslandica]|eukprot:XP_003385699.1 PREDICTED: uncharacterized protein LOC100635560 [Amphimedon queenslandica]
MASEETERQIEHLRTRKGVKCVIVMNLQGELVTTSVNEKSLDDEAVEAYHRLAYQILSGLKASIKQYSAQENLQYTRVRLKDSEVVIVPEEKFVVAVIQDPTAA